MVTKNLWNRTSIWCPDGAFVASGHLQMQISNLQQFHEFDVINLLDASLPAFLQAKTGPSDFERRNGWLVQIRKKTLSIPGNFWPCTTTFQCHRRYGVVALDMTAWFDFCCWLYTCIDLSFSHSIHVPCLFMFHMFALSVWGNFSCEHGVVGSSQQCLHTLKDHCHRITCKHGVYLFVCIGLAFVPLLFVSLMYYCQLSMSLDCKMSLWRMNVERLSALFSRETIFNRVMPVDLQSAPESEKVEMHQLWWWVLGKFSSCLWSQTRSFKNPCPG